MEGALAAALLRGECDALKKLSPDLVLHGFWPVAFSSCLLRDLPDFVGPLTLLPRAVRTGIMASIPKSVKRRVPLLRQRNLVRAYEEVGGRDNSPGNLFDMLKADFTVVNDFPVFYQGERIPSRFAVTGPLFPKDAYAGDAGPEVRRKMAPDSGKLRVFCTLGSSGGRDFLLEAVEALKRMKHCAAVVLCQPAVCPLENAKKAARGCPDLLITDAFVPALQIGRMADVTLCHGGQGTLQTAVAAGTPIVGFAMQPEQQINLDHIASFGAAIRLPSRKWKAGAYPRRADGGQRRPPVRLEYKNSSKNAFCYGRKAEAAKAIWNYWLSRR